MADLLELRPGRRRVATSLGEIAEADEDQGELVLDRGGFDNRLSRLVESETLESVPDGRFHVAALAIAASQRMKQRPSPAIIEIGADATSFLEEHQSALGLSGVGQDGCLRNQETNPKIRTERSRTRVFNEELLNDAARFRRVIGLVVGGSEPVAGMAGFRN
jgi:hypothetical protein